MRGCNEARPDRDWGEPGLQLQRPSAESAKTRGASESEPAALKVQLGEGLTLLFDVPLGSLEENLLNLLIL